MATQVVVRNPKEIVSTYVPVIFNGKELTHANHRRHDLALSDFINRYINKINLKPPYQRDETWSQPREKLFIASCFNQMMPVPPFYLVKANRHDNCAQFEALDCRQRVTAIKHFIQDEFPINVILTFANGTTKKKRLYWNDIKEDQNYWALKEEFETKVLSIVIFDYMPVDDRRKIFSALNHGVPLNADEQTYCNNFLARWILQHVFEKLFDSISEFMQPKVKNQRRFGHIRSVHELLILCGDMTLNGTCDARRLRKTDRMISARLVHDKLDQIGHEYDDLVTDEVLTEMGLIKRLPILKEVLDLMAVIYTENGAVGRQDENPDLDVHARNIIDPVAFLYKCVVEEKITVRQLKLRKDDLVKFLEQYYKKKPELSLNQSTSDGKVMKAKFELLEQSFQKHLS